VLLALGAIGVALAVWWHSPEYQPSPVGNPLLPPDAPPPVIAAQPTIELPAQPTAFTTEKLRGDLLEMVENLLARHPEVPEALHTAAMLYADLQKIPEAQELWRKCVRLAPHQAGPYVGLASAAMELGQDEQAIDTLKAARAAGCSTPEIYHEQAAALAKLGQLEEAVQVAQDGLRAFPESAENRLQLGQLQIQLGEYPVAEATLREVLARGRTSQPLVFALATACERQGKSDEAADFREQFNDFKAKLAASPTGFQESYDRELLRIATTSIAQASAVYDRQGQSDEAERLLLWAYGLDPQRAEVASSLAALLRRQGRIADARLVQRRVVELEPKEAAHHINLASLSAQLGDHELAESSLQEVVRLRPDLPAGYAGLAQLYLQTGQPDQARWYAEAALRQKSDNPQEAARTYLLLAAACEKLSDRAAADAAMAQARRLAPNLP
jgi:tetratricopeptide (TPR) repeat protein